LLIALDLPAEVLLLLGALGAHDLPEGDLVVKQDGLMGHHVLLRAVELPDHPGGELLVPELTAVPLAKRAAPEEHHGIRYPHPIPHRLLTTIQIGMLKAIPNAVPTRNARGILHSCNIVRM